MRTRETARVDAVRTLEHAASYLEDLRAERPVGRRLVAPHQELVPTEALELVYRRIHRLREEHPRIVAPHWAALVTRLEYWIGAVKRAGRMRKQVGRKVLCPEWGIQARVVVKMGKRDVDSPRLIDVVACTLFPGAAPACSKECLRQL